MKPVRVLITDDHLIVREGLRLILETVDDIELVGEAKDGAECLALIPKLDPDVILMDLQMPGMDGFTALKQIKKDYQNVAVVILTTYNEDEMMIKGLEEGASSFLLKDTDRESLLETIYATARGEILLKPEILQRVLTGQKFAKQSDKNMSGNISLTDREHEVLLAAAHGDRNKEIAYKLGISERTIKAHLTSIFNKLGVDSRAAAVAIAIQKGLIELGD